MGRPWVYFEAKKKGRTSRHNAILDTGAHHTILRHEVAEDLKVSCRPGEPTEDLEMGGRVEQVCKRRVSLAIKDTDCEVDLDVYFMKPDCPLPSIIGADYMERTGSVVDLRRNQSLVSCDLKNRDDNPPVEHDFRGGKFAPPHGTGQKALSGLRGRRHTRR